MDKRLSIKASPENAGRIKKIHNHFNQKPDDIGSNNSLNEIANTAMLIGLLELGRRHKIKFS